MIIKPMLGRSTFIAYGIGPMARDALDAIGCPSDVDKISIEWVGDDYTLSGRPVLPADAGLVYNAWRCDPKRFSEEAPERLIDHMRRSIIVRRLLGGTAA